MSTVLVIDDEPDILKVFEDYLTGEGYAVVTASSGRLGLSRFLEHRPDAILCDLSLKDLSGVEVLRAIRLRSPYTPFVVISGSTDVSEAVEALKAGAWDYLMKPIPDLELLPPLLVRLEERAIFIREKDEYQSRLERQVAVRTAQLTHELCEKDILLAEVHHRVKNNLQIIQTILGLQKAWTPDLGVQRVLEECESRIQALALVQESMADSDQATGVWAQQYVEGVVRYLTRGPARSALPPVTCEVHVERLSPQLAFSLGLALNEIFLADQRNTASTIEVKVSPWDAGVCLTIKGLDPVSTWGRELVDFLCRGRAEWSPLSIVVPLD